MAAVSVSCQGVKIIFHHIKSLIPQFLIGALASEGVKINAVTVQNEVDTTHRRIAFMRGQPFNSDSEDRWKSIVEVSREMGITIDPKLVVQLEKDISSPELGYQVMQQLLAQHLRFTAVVAFNYMSAIVRHSRPARLRPARAGRCFCHRARRHSRRRLQQSTSDHDPTTLNPNGKDGGTMRAQPAARLRTVSGTDYV